ncbi:DinB family protein [Flavobacteriaceae bacterium 3-367]|uniref:DinB family protein n=1 Tax=Eudoraea algarum TaxID=3417568 RepID=UPI00326D5DBF
MTAQKSNFKNEYLKKLKNSLEYTLDVANKMPEAHYNYKPIEDVRSFGEQLVHIGEGMAYIGNSGLSFQTVKQPNSNNKEEVISYLKAQYGALQNAIENKEQSYFEETTSFWAGRMTRRKILNIVFDHCTHHRAQAIVCLRMKNIKSPNYVGW